MTAEFKVFDGISLILRNAEIHKFDSYSSYPSGFVEIVYCKDGRIEYALKNMVIYLKKRRSGDYTRKRKRIVYMLSYKALPGSICDN